MKYILFFLLFATNLSAQWDLLIDLPHVATGIEFDSAGNRYISLQQGVVLRNQDTFMLVDVWYDNEMGLDAIEISGNWMYLHYSSTDTMQRVDRVNLVTSDYEELLAVSYVEDAVPPYSDIHRGGFMEVHEDILFVGFGSGGFGDVAQDSTDFRGKIIAYRDSVATIYAMGLRNPFSGTFNKKGLWIADAGQSWDEINLVTKGGNYGWPYFDANVALDTTVNPSDFDFPVYSYTEPGSNAVIGGVYKQGFWWTDFIDGAGGILDTNYVNTFLQYPTSITGMAINPLNNMVTLVAWEGKVYQEQNILAIDEEEETEEEEKPIPPPYWREAMAKKYGNFIDVWGRGFEFPPYGASFSVIEYKWIRNE